MRRTDLTGKLGLEPKPVIAIGDVELTVDDGADNILVLMDIIGDGMSPKGVAQAAALLFDKPSQKKLKDLKLNFGDYATVVEAAMQLVMGGAEGEAETPATTS